MLVPVFSTVMIGGLVTLLFLEKTGDCAKNLVLFLGTLRMNNNAELRLESCDELPVNEYKIYRERGLVQFPLVQFGVILSSSFSR